MCVHLRKMHNVPHQQLSSWTEALPDETLANGRIEFGILSIDKLVFNNMPPMSFRMQKQRQGEPNQALLDSSTS